FSVHQESIVMMSVIQLDLNEPGTVRLALHWVGGSIPIIEIPYQMDLGGLGRNADKIYRLPHFLCGIAVLRKVRTCEIHGVKQQDLCVADQTAQRHNIHLQSPTAIGA